MPHHRVTIKKRRRVGFRGAGPYWFDFDEADRRVWFIEHLCTHIKGACAGEPYKLSPHEKRLVEELFGWKRKDAEKPGDCSRQYRTLWYEVPRKNSKSTLAAALALSILFLDNEPGCEIYGAAGDKDQAGIIFEAASAMIGAEPLLAEHVRIYGATGGGQRRSIVDQRDHAVYRVLSAEAYSKHGLNPHAIIVDEVHVQPNRNLVDTLRTGMGARRQPLELYLTTAGTGRTSIAWELHDYADKIIKGVIDDDAFLPIIYAAGADDDWTDPKVWAKANPNLGRSIRIEYLEQECERAKSSPAYENTFRRLHLNQWTEQSVRWLKMRQWDRCAGALPDLRRRRCYAGFDLASILDLTAFVLAFPPVDDAEPLYLLPFFWIPEENVAERVERDRVPYDAWIEQGFVKTTPGNVTDYDGVRADINALADQYDIAEIAVDRYNANQLIGQLSEQDGLPAFAHGQGFVSMATPTKEFEALVRRGGMAHGGNPVLRWNAANVAVKMDPAGNMKPDKEKSTERIDGIVAAIMAVGRALLDEGGSIYDSNRRDGFVMLS